MQKTKQEKDLLGMTLALTRLPDAIWVCSYLFCKTLKLAHGVTAETPPKPKHAHSVPAPPAHAFPFLKATNRMEETQSYLPGDKAYP